MTAVDLVAAGLLFAAPVAGVVYGGEAACKHNEVVESEAVSPRGSYVKVARAAFDADDEFFRFDRLLKRFHCVLQKCFSSRPETLLENVLQARSNYRKAGSPRDPRSGRSSASALARGLLA